MNRLRLAAVVLVFAFAAAQLFRPAHSNPPIDGARTLQAQIGSTDGASAALDRACGDCHSDRTTWPWYSEVAPLSWLMTWGVARGRQAVNFSEWADYTPDQQRQLLALVCADVSSGKMPGGIWTTLHPETHLSTREVEAICGATRLAAAEVGDGARR